jgi:hypothetical protein
MLFSGMVSGMVFYDGTKFVEIIQLKPNYRFGLAIKSGFLPNYPDPEKVGFFMKIFFTK